MHGRPSGLRSRPLLLSWLLGDMERRNPEYFSELESRFQSGFDYEEIFRREGTFDGWVPVHSPDGGVDFWISTDGLADLQARLFPHEAEDGPTFGSGRQLVVVMLHSALEHLARDYGLWDQRSGKSVVTVLGQHFKWHERDRELQADLIDLRETRNLIAHHSAVVNVGYVKMVQRTHFQIGETRTVGLADVARFSRAVERVGQAVRSAS